MPADHFSLVNIVSSDGYADDTNLLIPENAYISYSAEPSLISAYDNDMIVNFKKNLFLLATSQ